jgi:phosphate-selective porin OprO/OprP
MKISGNKLGGKRHHKPAIATVALGALMSFQAGTARADDTAAEIRFLKKRLMQLEEKVARQDKQIRGVAKFPPMPPAPETQPIVCKDQPCPEPPPPPPPVFVSFANGLKVESWDGAFGFKIGGRIFVDGGVSTQPIQTFAGVLPFFPAHGAQGFSNQVGFRQARMEVEGRAWKNWEYKAQYDFTTSTNGLVQGGFRDWWLAYKLEGDFIPGTNIFAVKVGQQYEASSMNKMASSKYRDFIERPLATDGTAITGDRHIGIAPSTGGETWGFWGKPSWSLQAGLYSTSWQDGRPQNPSTTGVPITAINFGVPAGNASLLDPVSGGHQYWDFATRATYAPIHDDWSLLHLGGWFRYQKPNDATAINDDRVLQPGLGSASEANILKESLLGTQPLTCFAIPNTQLIGTNCTKNVEQYGAELEAAWGPFSVQGEWVGSHYNRDPGIIIRQGAPGAATLNFSGWYLYATWYLTGESRAEQYRSYDDINVPGNGNDKQIHILHPLSAGGWGAWELAARVDELNLNSGGFLVLQPIGTPSNIQGGRQTDFTLGLNWYPDVGIRFMANWVNVLQYSANVGRPDLNGIHPNLFEIRAQVDW